MSPFMISRRWNEIKQKKQNVAKGSKSPARVKWNLAPCIFSLWRANGSGHIFKTKGNSFWNRFLDWLKLWITNGKASFGHSSHTQSQLLTLKCEIHMCTRDSLVILWLVGVPWATKSFTFTAKPHSRKRRVERREKRIRAGSLTG